MAAEECCREPRKRRERRDSGCAHERKERRSHSEERVKAHTPPSTPALHDYNRFEVERRAERLSRARRPQYGGKRRRAALRAPVHIEQQVLTEADDNIRCSSPPKFNINQLYKQQYREENADVGLLHSQLCDRGEEPVPSAAAQRPPPPPPAPDVVVVPRPPSPRNEVEKRLEKIKRKMYILKRSILKHESDFESRNGYPMTRRDRIIDVELTRMVETLKRLHVEKRWIKCDPEEYALSIKAAKQQKERDDKLDVALKSDKSMADLVVDIEEWLEGCRKAESRSLSSESRWMVSQVAAEKTSVQKVLLRLEAARGRPEPNSADRGYTRHLYERYRVVKRALATFKAEATMSNGELATIHEHETMLFNTSVDSSSEEKDRSSDQTDQDSSQVTVVSVGRSSDDTPSSASSANEEEDRNESLHCLTPEELYRLLLNAKFQKAILRRSIKEYEVSFEAQNCRKVQKDDKQPHEEEYLRYKAIKARIKLLNALINKQKDNP